MSSNRHSYRSVSRFFPALQAVIDAEHTTTSVIEINPTSMGLATTTCAARLRDARQAVEQGVVVPPFNAAKFTDLVASWVITDDGKTVSLIHVERHKQFLATQQQALLQVELKGETVVERTLVLDEVKALCYLLGNRVLSGEYRVRFHPDIHIVELRAFYDVAIIDNNDGTHTII